MKVVKTRVEKYRRDGVERERAEFAFETDPAKAKALVDWADIASKRMQVALGDGTARVVPLSTDEFQLHVAPEAFATLDDSSDNQMVVTDRCKDAVDVLVDAAHHKTFKQWRNGEHPSDRYFGKPFDKKARKDK